jgi:hypothetical protein
MSSVYKMGLNLNKRKAQQRTVLCFFFRSFSRHNCIVNFIPLSILTLTNNILHTIFRLSNQSQSNTTNDQNTPNNKSISERF